jgi:hypothetical protein
MTSAERGDNVTMLSFVNAAGKLFPGVFVFPRKKVNDKMKNMPQGFIPLAYPSGWMTENNFFVLHHDGTFPPTSEMHERKAYPSFYGQPH